MPNTGKQIALIGCALLISSCGNNVEDAIRAPGTIEMSRSAGPGGSRAEPREAGEIFAKACVLTSPSFSGTQYALSAYPFTQHSRTKVYFHNDLDLSVKLQSRTCSMEFASSASEELTIEGLARGIFAVNKKAPPRIDMESETRTNGRTYFVLGLTSR